MEPARCQAVAVSTPEGTALQVPLGCVDPDGGDALSYVLGKPAHGQLGAVDDATGAVLYAPDPGFAGADGFDVTATDYVGTASTRVTIQVRGGVPAADTTAPVLSASFSHKRFRVGARATAFSARRAPTGTTLRWRLSEAATVRVAFSRTGAGRRVGARCVKPTQRNSSRSHCRRRIGEGVLTRRGATGAGRLVFSGRIGRHALRRGAHRATVTATDQAGNRSKPVQLAFRIVRR
jgi:hypothetical protein